MVPGFELSIPKAEVDKLQRKKEFLKAVEAIQKMNFSQALELLDKVLKDNPKSKYVLIFKVACLNNLLRKKLDQLHRINEALEKKVSQGLFDEGIMNETIEVTNSVIDFSLKQKEIADYLCATYPDSAQVQEMIKVGVGQHDLGLADEAKKTVESFFRAFMRCATPQQFEKIIGYLFGKIGYAVTVTPYVADYGADVIAEKPGEKIVVQVKKYVGSNVGAPEIQQILGSMWKYKATKAIIVTTTDFTKAAVEQAKGAPIELWNINTLNRVIEKHLFH